MPRINTEHGTRNTEHGTRNPELERLSVVLGFSDEGPLPLVVGFVTASPRPEAFLL